MAGSGAQRRALYGVRRHEATRYAPIRAFPLVRPGLPTKRVAIGSWDTEDSNLESQISNLKPRSSPVCPLCYSDGSSLFHQDARRPYYRCDTCHLVFVPPAFFLTAAAERAHYDLHENDPGDTRYRKFLSRLCDPMLACLSPESQVLDFGSGPGPTLSVMLEEAGHRVTLYDHFYADNRQVLDRMYDGITASEVVEHLHDPAVELERLWRCLKPGGVLGVMTKQAQNQSAFAQWHYIRDPTHVCFFSPATFRWLADQWTANLTAIGQDVTLLAKPSVVSGLHSIDIVD